MVPEIIKHICELWNDYRIIHISQSLEPEYFSMISEPPVWSHKNLERSVPFPLYIIQMHSSPL